MINFNPANKYKNKKVTVDGIIFDSTKESKIYLDLKGQKERGEIKDFQMQVPFELVPKQTEIKTIFKNGKPVEVVRVAEHAVKYIADFVVCHLSGEVTVVDAKGNRKLDAKYPIKRKLLRYVHKLVIMEV